jgi:hypothetical protein
MYSLDQLSDLLQGTIAILSKPIFIIFHDPRVDLRALKLAIGIDHGAFTVLSSAGYPIRFPTPINSTPPIIVDTQRLYAAWKGRPGFQVKLQTALLEFHVPTRRLHNAGNDAHYTLLLCEALMRVACP